MAVLPENDRLRIWRGLMRWWSATLTKFDQSWLKLDLKLAVDAADLWVDSNSASYNTALPTIFRTNASAEQKSLLLVAVILMRFNVDMLKRIFGEVD